MSVRSRAQCQEKWPKHDTEIHHLSEWNPCCPTLLALTTNPVCINLFKRKLEKTFFLKYKDPRFFV